MDNRDLDKMIQDKLGDFRETPDPRVWDRVRASLDRKKKKDRLIPLWLRIGAAAAIIAAGVFLLTPGKDSSPEVPAVSPAVAQPEASRERNAETPDAEKSLPGKTDDGLAGDGTSEEKQNSLDSPRVSFGVASSSENTKSPSAEDSVQGALKNDRLAAYEKPLEEQDLPDEQPGAVAQVVEAEKLAAIEEKPNPVTDTQRAETGGENAVADIGGPDSAKENLPEKSIFEELEAMEAVAESEDPEGKWSIGPSLAPVYFNSFGNGSPISSSFLNNSKSGTINMSYGLQVSYQLSRKLSLRSGIHRVDYGYNTDDIGFTASPTARPNSLIRTISYSENSKNLVVHSTSGGEQPPREPVASDVSGPSAAREGQMLQEFGYLEIPLEMQYNLLDRKLGINLIGGLSSLFLVENSVSLQSGESVTEIGEATNMNSLNFSTNLGLGFYYRLNPSFEINLQPMFKYQVNTFTETSGSFRPYSIGVYSGLNFRF
ncbi:MAG: outer membrane beta-barrel protein [Flavobacteriaceae bacterium]|jgi:hypothetical protein|nr:MAG: outer membrane beta-barrel protein [Flavobacteriaceae bacterium]